MDLGGVVDEHSAGDPLYPRLARLLKLLQILNGGLERNASELAELLDVSRRTIFRYLNILESCGFRIVYDSATQKYRATDTMNLRRRLDASEALSISMVLKMVNFHPSLQSSAALITGTLAEGLDQTSRNLFWQASQWIAHETPPVPSNLDWDIVQTLFSGYAQRRKVRITFQGVDQSLETTLLSPYGLEIADEKLWVIGRSSVARERVRLPVEAVTSVELTDDQFELPPRA